MMDTQTIEELKTRVARFQTIDSVVLSDGKGLEEGYAQDRQTDGDSTPSSTQAESRETEIGCLQEVQCDESNGSSNSGDPPVVNSCGDGSQSDGHLEVDTSTTKCEEDSHSKDQTGTMSPRSFATFKGLLVHTPEMNLPWESMRSVRQCNCGVTFSYSVRKVNTCTPT